jgi:hypothetical protein
MPYYTGIGSRTTPTIIADLMTEIGIYFGRHGIILRSGGAQGADSAFEQGCDSVNGLKEIYLPSRTFMKRISGDNTFYFGDSRVNTNLSYEVGKKVWNSRINKIEWDRLKPFTKALMARNTLQILGANLSVPTNIVICWTIDGEATGGTGQAIHLVEMINSNKKLDYVIPIINLQKEESREMITRIVRGLDPVEFIDTMQDIYLRRYHKGQYKE